MNDTAMRSSERTQLATAAEPKTLIESAYRALREDIVSARYAPGEKLRVEHLKDRYAVGAGTLREALARLASDTLVVAEGQRGFRVAPLSLSDFEDITRTRILLECEAIRQSIAYGDDAWEADVAAAFHLLSRAEEKLNKRTPETLAEWELRNRQFHRTLIAACPSTWIRHFLGLLLQQSERYRRFVLARPPIPRDIHAEHAAIMRATIARDARKAAQLIESHIQLTLDAVRKVPPEAFKKSTAKPAAAKRKPKR